MIREGQVSGRRPGSRTQINARAPLRRQFCGEFPALSVQRHRRDGRLAEKGEGGRPRLRFEAASGRSGAERNFPGRPSFRTWMGGVARTVRWAGRGAGLAILVVLAGLLAPAGALGQGATFPRWSLPTVVDRIAPTIQGLPMTAVSCPAVNVCVAADRRGEILSTSRPTRPSEWLAHRLFIPRDPSVASSLQGGLGRPSGLDQRDLRLERLLPRRDWRNSSAPPHLGILRSSSAPTSSPRRFYPTCRYYGTSASYAARGVVNPSAETAFERRQPVLVASYATRGPVLATRQRAHEPLWRRGSFLGNAR
jgi:hypothetical protein